MDKSRSHYVVVLMLSLVVGCAGSKAAQTSEKAVPGPVIVEATSEELFAAGVAEFDAGKLTEAEGKFSKALEKNPQLVAAQYNSAVIRERLGDLKGATKAYEAARKIDANHLPSIVGLGKVYRLQEKFSEAIALYEEALKTPDREFNASLLNELATSYRLAKKLDLAEATARKVLSRNKDNAEAYKTLSLIYFEQGNYKLAQFIIGNARKLDEKDPGLYNNLGLIFLKLEDKPAALAQFQRAVELDPNFAPGYVNIGAMALAYRDYVTAEKTYSKAIQLDPNSYEGHLGYAYALDGFKSKDAKKGLAAGAEFEKVLALKPDFGPALCGAGWAYSVEKSSHKTAVSYLEKCRLLPTTTPQEQAQIDGKLKSLNASLNGAAQTPAVAQEKPKSNASGTNLFDKVAEDAAKSEAASPSGAEATPEKSGEKTE